MLRQELCIVSMLILYWMRAIQLLQSPPPPDPPLEFLSKEATENLLLHISGKTAKKQMDSMHNEYLLLDRHEMAHKCSWLISSLITFLHLGPMSHLSTHLYCIPTEGQIGSVERSQFHLDGAQIVIFFPPSSVTVAKNWIAAFGFDKVIALSF